VSSGRYGLDSRSFCQGLHSVLSRDSVLKGISVAPGASPLVNLIGPPLGFHDPLVLSSGDEYSVHLGSQSVVPLKREDPVVLWNHDKKTWELCCGVCVCDV
jgi:hypothetical protein